MQRMFLITAMSLASFAGLAIAQESGSTAAPGAPTAQTPRDTSHYNLESGRPAIQGYDPVAYFPEGGGNPMKGVKEHAVAYRGVIYWFTNQSNHEKFLADPDRYEPTYGGWCASAMADGGRKVEIDPKNFKVTDGRLFLFYKGIFQDAQTYWTKDEPKNTEAADSFWMKLAHESPRAGR